MALAVTGTETRGPWTRGRLLLISDLVHDQGLGHVIDEAWLFKLLDTPLGLECGHHGLTQGLVAKVGVIVRVGVVQVHVQGLALLVGLGVGQVGLDCFVLLRAEERGKKES